MDSVGVPPFKCELDRGPGGGFRVRVEENRSFIVKRSSFHFKITFTPPTLHNAAEHS